MRGAECEFYGADGDTVGHVIDQLLEGRLRPIADYETCGGGGGRF